MDEAGIVSEMYGRKILGARLRKGTPIHTYLPGPHRGVFNIAAFKQYQEIILCESLIDALTFYCNGFPNVTASFGVSGFTDELLQAFKDHAITKVYIAYDADTAGNQAAEKLAKTLMAVGMDCFRVRFPKGMDANLYACQVKPADKSLGLVIRKAGMDGQRQKKRSQAMKVEEVPPPVPAIPNKKISLICASPSRK